jgi:hypothetical protein
MKPSEGSGSSAGLSVDPIGRDLFPTDTQLSRFRRRRRPTFLRQIACAFGGGEKNEATRRLFYLAENYERLFEDRIITSSLAKKWIERFR